MVLKTNSKFRNDTYSFRYPTRGGRLNQDELESDKIYHEEFTAANEANHKGKIVAIDIDDKKIIHMDYDLGNVISYHNYESSNRIRIRRVGKDPRVGVRIW